MPQVPEKKEAKLTRFTNYLLHGLSPEKAAIKAGYSKRAARTAYKNLVPKAKVTFANILQTEISMGEQAKIIAEGMRATTMQFFSYKGHVTDEREIPDWRARAEYLELAQKIQGTLVRSDDKPASGISIRVTFSDYVRKQPITVEAETVETNLLPPGDSAS